MKGKATTPPKGKETSEKKLDAIPEGRGHMSGPNHAGPQKPGVTTQEGAKTGGKFTSGGSGHMSGPNHAGPQTPGTTAQGGAKSGDKFIKGGSTKMFGYTGSQTAKPA